MGRTLRVAFAAVALAALAVTGSAQDETTGPAEGRTMERGPGAMRRGTEFTTATFEQYWERTQQPSLEAAGIPQEKIEQLKQMELEARMALSRGERPDLRALAKRRNEILTQEEKQKLMEVRRERRDRMRGTTTGTLGLTTGTQPMSDGGAAAPAPGAATE